MDNARQDVEDYYNRTYKNTLGLFENKDLESKSARNNKI